MKVKIKKRLIKLFCTTILLGSVIPVYESINAMDLELVSDIIIEHYNVKASIEEKPFIESKHINKEGKDILHKVYGDTLLLEDEEEYLLNNPEKYLLHYIDKEIIDFLKENNLKILILEREERLSNKNLTENLYRKASEHNYTSSYKIDKIIDEIPSKEESYVAGSYFYPEKTIVSYNKDIFLLHEIGHGIDFSTKEKYNMNLSDTKSFEKIYEKEKDLLQSTDYAKSTTKEFFAEYFYLFLKNKHDEEFKQEMPLTYEYMSTIYEYIKSEQKLDKKLIKTLEKIKVK